MNADLTLYSDLCQALWVSLVEDARCGRNALTGFGELGAAGCVWPGPLCCRGAVRAASVGGYRPANGAAIKTRGQVTFKLATAAGDRCSIPFQVAEVEQPLLSVAHLTSAGNRVELGHASGRVVNLTTGRAIALERRGGVYIMRMYVQGLAPAPAPFRRQGA